MMRCVHRLFRAARRFLPGLLLLLLGTLHLSGASLQAGEGREIVSAEAVPQGQIDPDLLPVGYSGEERLVYDVSWSGGIKIGELHLEVKALAEAAYEIHAWVTTRNGALNLLYPIDDVYATRVRGAARLPYQYEVWQREGYSYRAHRLTDYFQEEGRIVVWKNSRPDGEYLVDGKVNNEFSSFFNSRLMPLVAGESFLVPTFADRKRVAVVVHVVAAGVLTETVLGPVPVVEVTPQLTFKGLYEKKGDTVIWYTDDLCRVPVRISSKIVIGSLTAELVAYRNPACPLYSTVPTGPAASPLIPNNPQLRSKNQ